MASDAQRIPNSGQPPKRRIRNFLLDPRFQLKYTGAVVAVTVIVTGAVGAWLGTEAYRYSTALTEAVTVEAAVSLGPELFEDFQEESKAKDAEVRRNIVFGVSALVIILALALGFTGIVVTHKVVGPAYKLKLLLGDVAAGTLNVRGGLRKGDELQDVGDAFKGMVSALRARREEELEDLERAIEKARGAGLDGEALEALTALRDRLQRTLEG